MKNFYCFKLQETLTHNSLLALTFSLVPGTDLQKFLYGPFAEPVECLDLVCQPIMALNLIMDALYDTNRTISEITNVTDVINEYLFRYVEKFPSKQSLQIRIVLFVI